MEVVNFNPGLAPSAAALPAAPAPSALGADALPNAAVPLSPIAAAPAPATSMSVPGAPTLTSHAESSAALLGDQAAGSAHAGLSELPLAAAPAALSEPPAPAPTAAPRARTTNRVPHHLTLAARDEAFGLAVPLMLARRANRKKRRQLSPEERAAREQGWNYATFNSTPPTLKGVKLARKEPWDDDANYFVDLLKQQDPFSIDNTANVRFWESTARDVWTEESWSGAERKRVQQRKSLREIEKPWDASVWHPQPYLLRGVQPVTRESWDEDRKVRTRNDPDQLRRERLEAGIPSPYELQAREAEALLTPRFGWFGSAPPNETFHNGDEDDAASGLEYEEILYGDVIPARAAEAGACQSLWGAILTCFGMAPRKPRMTTPQPSTESTVCIPPLNLTVPGDHGQVGEHDQDHLAC